MTMATKSVVIVNASNCRVVSSTPIIQASSTVSGTTSNALRIHGPSVRAIAMTILPYLEYVVDAVSSERMGKTTRPTNLADTDFSIKPWMLSVANCVLKAISVVAARTTTTGSESRGVLPSVGS
jgi:hypothetical protein